MDPGTTNESPAENRPIGRILKYSTTYAEDFEKARLDTNPANRRELRDLFARNLFTILTTIHERYLNLRTVKELITAEICGQLQTSSVPDAQKVAENEVETIFLTLLSDALRDAKIVQTERRNAESMRATKEGAVENTGNVVSRLIRKVFR